MGRAIATALVERGDTVLLVCPDLETAAADCERIGSGCNPGTIDVCNHLSCDALVAKATSLGVPSIIVNCAAPSEYAPLTSHAYLSWKRTLDVSLLGAMNVIGAFGTQMVSSGTDGVIVNISSINATLPVPGYAAYCAAKAGLEMLTKTAALELAPHVRVNAIAPGPLERPSRLATAFPAFYDDLKRRHPLAQRLTCSSDVVGVLCFLIGDSARWITGQTLVTDGGVSLNYGELPVFQDDQGPDGQ
jgi:NAD(P)-dependent dehydrogenase (short-subunit alcohol dehydrogenase family)